ncbi:MAG TPA: hypothetical protein VD978_31355 [Azospirillum sp.]|nr:hypothetical protein [Azospirillum sp.]
MTSDGDDQRLPSGFVAEPVKEAFDRAASCLLVGLKLGGMVAAGELQCLFVDVTR